MNDFERITRINEQDGIVQECEAALMLAFGMVAFGLGWAVATGINIAFWPVPWWTLYPAGVILILAALISHFARKKRLEAWRKIGILERPE